MAPHPKTEDPASLPKRVYRSIFRGPVWPRDDRERRWVVFHHLVLHFRPVRLRRSTLALSHTFGLGGMTFLLFLVLLGTGAALTFFYQPFPESAFESLRFLETEVTFGPFVRGLHHWSAQFLLAILLLHLLRVFFTGGFHPPRQFNWVLGLGLLALVLLASFTGYLLPWDQLSYWAVTITIGMLDYVPWVGPWIQGFIRSGSQLDGTTLVRFYSLHTTAIPLTVVLLLGFHFWRVRKAKGVVPPRTLAEAEGGDAETDDELVLALPDLLLRELVVALCLLAVVSLTAALFAVPLGAPANPGMSPNPVKAPWYFVGFQELLVHFHPLFAVVVLPLAIVLLLVALPYLTWDERGEGVWFRSRLGRRASALGTVAGLLLAILWVAVDELRGAASSDGWGAWLPPLFLLAVLGAFRFVVTWRGSATRDDARLALFCLLAAGLVVLTLTGLFFRGEGMALTWPWH